MIVKSRSRKLRWAEYKKRTSVWHRIWVIRRRLDEDTVIWFGYIERKIDWGYSESRPDISYRAYNY